MEEQNGIVVLMTIMGNYCWSVMQQGLWQADECKLVLNPETDLRAIYSTLKQLEKPHREFSSIMQMIADEVYDDQFSNFQRSHDNYVVVTFAEKILKM